MDAKARGRPRTKTPREVMEVSSSSSVSGLDWGRGLSYPGIEKNQKEANQQNVLVDCKKNFYQTQKYLFIQFDHFSLNCC